MATLSRVRTAAALLSCCALLGGCVNQWQVHYAGERLAPLARSEPVSVTRTTLGEVALIGAGAEWPAMGHARFLSTTEAGAGELERFARLIGAAEVVWARESAGVRTYETVVHQYVSEKTRTRGTVTLANGRQQTVDLESTTGRWVDVPVTITEERHWHSAVFFAGERDPAGPPQGSER